MLFSDPHSPGVLVTDRGYIPDVTGLVPHPSVAPNPTPGTSAGEVVDDVSEAEVNELLAGFGYTPLDTTPDFDVEAVIRIPTMQGTQGVYSVSMGKSSGQAEKNPPSVSGGNSQQSGDVDRVKPKRVKKKATRSPRGKPDSILMKLAIAASKKKI